MEKIFVFLFVFVVGVVLLAGQSWLVQKGLISFGHPISFGNAVWVTSAVNSFFAGSTVASNKKN